MRIDEKEYNDNERILTLRHESLPVQSDIHNRMKLIDVITVITKSKKSKMQDTDGYSRLFV